MTFAAGLRVFLASQKAIAEGVGDRLFPVLAPPPEDGGGLFPDSLVYRLDSRNAQPGLGRAPQRSARWQFVVLSSDHARAHGLADAVEDALNGFAGLMGDVRVLSCQLQDASDHHDSDFDLYAVEQAYEVMYLVNQ